MGKYPRSTMKSRRLQRKMMLTSKNIKKSRKQWQTKISILLNMYSFSLPMLLQIIQSFTSLETTVLLEAFSQNYSITENYSLLHVHNLYIKVTYNFIFMIYLHIQCQTK